MYLYIKDLLFLVNKRENTKYDPKYFIECSDKMKRYLWNIDEYNPGTKHKALVVFDDMITDKISKKKPNPMSTELFIRGRI